MGNGGGWAFLDPFRGCNPLAVCYLIARPGAYTSGQPHISNVQPRQTHIRRSNLISSVLAHAANDVDSYISKWHLNLGVEMEYISQMEKFVIF